MGPQDAPVVPELSLHQVSQAFGTTRALRDVSLELWAGEVHVLAGENGAGKSTLIRVLSGALTTFTGEVRMRGKRVRFGSPGEASRAGVATIHQDLSLLPNLSTVDNLLLATPGNPLAPVKRSRERDRARTLSRELGLDVDLDAAIETLPASERQLVEIARALGLESRVLILDEPTSALSEPEAERLFALLERARARGTALLYISHRMDEIFRLANRVSVLRDGERLFTRPCSDLSEEELVTSMLGRRLANEGARAVRTSQSAAAAASTAVLLAGAAASVSVRALSSSRPTLNSLSFDVAQGEILGLCGRRGSGADAVVHALFGSRGSVSGEFLVAGEPYVPATPRRALARGIALLPGDRRTSVFSELSVVVNATLSSLQRFVRAGVVDRAGERAAVIARSPGLRLKYATLDADARTLSGGNQQKLALLRCLLLEPRLLLLDDPTRGVDVGAKAEIHALLRELAAAGMGALLYSSELEELSALCHRVLILVDGKCVAQLDGERLNRDALLKAMMGQAA